MLTIAPLRFLGTISFSLYLVHLPIVVAYAFLFNLGPWSAILATVTSPVVAVGFYYACERPIHKLSQKIGSGIREREAVPSSVSS
jgi:peptidoglycan/LPS O-acetylase OafA/YrhL